MSKPTKKAYEVGYGKPPKHTQFQKGQINNPDGARGRRSKKAELIDIRKRLERVWREALAKEVSVSVAGATKKMRAIEVIVERVVNGAMKGDPRMLRELRVVMKEFPHLFEVPSHLREIQMTLVTPNPFRAETARLDKFLEVFPDVPEADLEVFRRYFPKDKQEFEESGKADQVLLGSKVEPLN